MSVAQPIKPKEPELEDNFKLTAVQNDDEDEDEEYQ